MKIFHITTAEEWSRAQHGGTYQHDSLASEGFIHLSSEDQVAATIDRYYQHTAGLLLLEVDPDRVPPGALVWEASTGGADFPHLYSELNLDAVIHVHILDGPDTGDRLTSAIPDATNPDATNPDASTSNAAIPTRPSPTPRPTRAETNRQVTMRSVKMQWTDMGPP